MKELILRDRTVTTKNPAFVMAIVNATPDSLFSESRGSLDRALRMIDEGADLLDIGGESTRPGSVYVDEKEELSRVVPLVREIRKHSNIPISIDTRKKSVMEAAFDASKAASMTDFFLVSIEIGILLCFLISLTKGTTRLSSSFSST